MSRPNKRKLEMYREEDDSEYESDIEITDPSYYMESSDSSDSSDGEDLDQAQEPLETVTPESSDNIKWFDVKDDFIPRKTVPQFKLTETSIPENSTETEVFLKLFPKSLFMWISDCTNERLNILADEKKKQIVLTDFHEIMIIIGCTLVMAYNRLPHTQMYWSQRKSLGNKLIKSSISRDRFMLVSSKLYFNKPVKPVEATKTYYMDEIFNCLKYTFPKARTEATHQSIDESMIKFKGRSAMKQFVPIKPIKRGIKDFGRSDAKTGYLYDLNLYTGKQIYATSGTLGERVVNALCSTIRGDDVSICIDRFYTSIELLKTLDFACVGTIMPTRKNLPTLTEKLERGESMAKCCNDGIIAMKWHDTKEFCLASNCHNYSISTVERKQKDGTRKNFECPEAIKFYNQCMGGVDLTDQFAVCYDIDRKSKKWWRRVYQRLLMNVVANSWILYQESNKRKMSLIDFLVPLSENLIAIGLSGTKNQRKPGTGRPSKRFKTMVNVGHLPIFCSTRRRCRWCSINKVQKRTLTMCTTCDVPLCIECFVPYHK